VKQQLAVKRPKRKMEYAVHSDNELIKMDRKQKSKEPIFVSGKGVIN